ncbi:MAG TPA: biotin transporter BioY [Actinomycetes bacterium]|nr:biotin transporter BioY [Actinomycetes bacterium]
MSSSAVPLAGRAVLADLLPGDRVRDAVLVVGYAVLTGLAAQLSIKLPFTPVPITGQTFAVLLGAAVLGWRRAALGMGLYLAAGLAGMPWFAEGRGGADMITVPSFGYVVGFLVAAAVVGWLAGRGQDRTPARTVLTMVAGNLLVYAFGLSWLMATLDVGLAKGMELGVTPFLPGDALKILLAAGLLPAAWALAGRRDR